MRRYESSLIDMGQVLLEAADATVGHVKRGIVGVLTTSALALLLAELIGAVAVVVGQWATVGAVSVPDAVQLQLDLVTPVACGLVLLLSIANLLRLAISTCVQAARGVVGSARLHRFSASQRDLGVWRTDDEVGVIVPMPVVPTSPLAPYRPSRPGYGPEYEPRYWPETRLDYYPDYYGEPRVFAEPLPSYSRGIRSRPYAAPPMVMPYGYAYPSYAYPAAKEGSLTPTIKLTRA